MTITQKGIDIRCRAAKLKYMMLGHKQASVAFLADLHGFVASEVERGSTIEQACARIDELMILLRRTNP